jgi:serine/threonine protein kinase
VGRGGLGVVYHASHEATGEVVALKVLNQPAADTVAARRLAREFRALSEIEHRNIVRVLDAGVHEDYPYLTMEYVDGLPLRTYLEVSPDDDHDYAPRPPPAPPEDSASGSMPGGRPAGDTSSSSAGVSAGALAWLDGEGEPDSLPPGARQGPGTNPGILSPELVRSLNRPARVTRLRDVLAQLCDGLAFIHARGLVHRDLKPSNILVAEGGTAKLVDFGLVKLAQSTGNTTATGHVVGTYRYMSPEQAKSAPVDGRSDLYALGGVLYEMLCGHPPFTHQQTAALLQAIVYQPPPPVDAFNPYADPALVRIAMRLLQKAPAERYQSAEEVARRLRQLGGS